ncbi:MAG: chemotaxis protein CheC [Eubacteriales bacterium]|nr:chemotaxis protein CheC [Eubacteriales bacterium]
MNYSDMDDQSRDILKELGNIGTGNAVSSLSQMMDCSFVIDTPVLQLVKYHEVSAVLSATEELQAGIIVEVFGKLEGVFLFLMNENFTETLLDNMLGEEKRDLTNLNDMEKSVISELGNIMCGSYIRALSQLLDMDMDVSVPDLCIDMGGAILSVPLSRFLRLSDDVLLIENVFRMGEKSFSCRILFLPELDSLTAMLETLGE